MTEPLMPTTHAGCPFCMATSFTFQTVKDGRIYILCCCGTPGPVCDTEILARIAWNTRPGEKAARVEGRRSALQDVAKGKNGVQDIIDKLIKATK